ncbi:FecR family protein [Pedobacter sp. GR22-6]|uniref:FecR family protein n=1 Tax=Pedobacter sp. GR22-6 TaxID=3127957 RepID=UPI00307EA884
MQDQDFKEILEKYTQGIASPDEEAWLERAYLNWNEDERVVPSDEVLNPALIAIRQQVMSATKPRPAMGIWTRISTAAAVLLLVSLLSWLFIDQFKTDQHIEIVAGTKDIKAGADRATLILANGKEIDLTNAADGQLSAEQTGLKITKSANGELTYELSDTETTAQQVTRYNTIRTPAGGKYKVVLQDSTQVWLNASSSLTYPTSFANADFRTVELKGEGYFEVAKLQSAARHIPFIVKTTDQEIRVLGTHFNVNAYEDERSTATTLLEGSVEVNGRFKLIPGQQARGEGTEIRLRNVVASDYVDWKSGEFNLNSGDFRTVMRKIARWYDVEIVYDETAPERVKNLGGWISRTKNISSVLNIMQETGKVHFKLEGRRVTVSK